MTKFLTVCLLLSLPQLLMAGPEYAASYVYICPSASGNLIIREMKVPSMEQVAKGAVGGAEAQLYLVKQDKLIALFDRGGRDVIPNPSLPALQEQKSPTAIGILLHDLRNPNSYWLQVIKTEPAATPSSLYTLRFPDLEESLCSVALCCYVPSMDAWAFHVCGAATPTQATIFSERRELRLMRSDGKVLGRGYYSLPNDEFCFGLQAVLLDESENHLALIVLETKGDGERSRVRAVTFNLSDLSEPPDDSFLTDECSEREGPSIFSSWDNRRLAVLVNNPTTEGAIVSVWSLIGGRPKRVAGPTSVPDMSGAPAETRAQWSAPGNHLVFANCKGENLNLMIMGDNLKVIARKKLSNCGGLSPCSPQPNSWYYFDHADCLIYDITPASTTEQWRIVRYDFRTNKAKVIRTAKYGLKYLLEHKDEILSPPVDLPGAAHQE